MARRTIIVIFSFFLISCESIPTKVEQVQVPVLICPKPPDIEKPDLEIYKLTEEDRKDPGKVAQAIKITLIQLQSYGVLLETIVKTYKNTSEEYDKLRQELEFKFPRKIIPEKINTIDKEKVDNGSKEKQ